MRPTRKSPPLAVTRAACAAHPLDTTRRYVAGWLANTCKFHKLVSGTPSKACGCADRPVIECDHEPATINTVSLGTAAAGAAGAGGAAGAWDWDWGCGGAAAAAMLTVVAAAGLVGLNTACAG